MANLFQSSNNQQNTDGSSLTMGERNQFEAERQNLLSDKHDGTIKNIKDLQELEKYMFQNLQSLNKSSAGSVEESDIIKKRIEELSAMRMALFNQLKSMYTDQQTETANSRSNLADQLTMTKVIDNELTNAQRQLDSLEKEYTNKKRLVELSDYEYDRYSSHKNILKIMVYGALGVLIIIYLMSFPWFPASVGMLSISIIVAIVLIVIAQRMLTNFTRTNLFWNKFSFDKKLPPESDRDKKDFRWTDLLSTTCENIRDQAQTAAQTGINLLQNEMDPSTRLSIEPQNSQMTTQPSSEANTGSGNVESFTSFVEDSEPKNAESFYNIF